MRVHGLFSPYKSRNKRDVELEVNKVTLRVEELELVRVEVSDKTHG